MKRAAKFIKRKDKPVCPNCGFPLDNRGTCPRCGFCGG